MKFWCICTSTTGNVDNFTKTQLFINKSISNGYCQGIARTFMGTRVERSLVQLHFDTYTKSTGARLNLQCRFQAQL